MTAPTPAKATCERCKRPLAVDDVHRWSVWGDKLCWRLSRGMAFDDTAERDCYRTALARAEERLRRLVEAVREERQLRGDAFRLAQGCAQCTPAAFSSLCGHGCFSTFAKASQATGRVDALLADGDA